MMEIRSGRRQPPRPFSRFPIFQCQRIPDCTSCTCASTTETPILIITSLSFTLLVLLFTSLSSALLVIKPLNHLSKIIPHPLHDRIILLPHPVNPAGTQVLVLAQTVVCCQGLPDAASIHSVAWHRSESLRVGYAVVFVDEDGEAVGCWGGRRAGHADARTVHRGELGAGATFGHVCGLGWWFPRDGLGMVRLQLMLALDDVVRVREARRPVPDC